MAIDISAVARVVGVDTQFTDFRAGQAQFLPQRVAIFAQGNDGAVYPTTKRQITSAFEAGQLYGHGSQVHLIARQLLPANGVGVGSVPVTVYPLETPSGGAAATGKITPAAAPTGAGMARVFVGGALTPTVSFNAGQTVSEVCTAIADAINGVTWAPVTATATATDVNLTAKWSGDAGNGIKIVADETGSAAVDLAVTDMAGGTGIAAVTDAIERVGAVWETLAINSQPVTDGATLDEFEQFGEGRWGAITKKPLVVFTGSNSADLNTLTAITDSRKSDRTNSIIPAPGSPELPFVIAARAVSRVATVAQNNPAKDYARQTLAGLIPGEDGQQWNYPQRDTAVKSGLSTTDLRNGVTELSDTVTCYHPEGIDEPGYRYVNDIVKLQNVIYNIELKFASERWDGAPLILDDQPTVNPDAKRPKDAIAEMYGVIDGLAAEAVITDPEFSKANTTAGVSAQNPKRLDVETSVKLSGNANIINVGLNFGFYFGG